MKPLMNIQHVFMDINIITNTSVCMLIVLTREHKHNTRSLRALAGALVCAHVHRMRTSRDVPVVKLYKHSVEDREDIRLLLVTTVILRSNLNLESNAKR